jgi:hypothetical protein
MDGDILQRGAMFVCEGCADCDFISTVTTMTFVFFLH